MTFVFITWPEKIISLDFIQYNYYYYKTGPSSRVAAHDGFDKSSKGVRPGRKTTSIVRKLRAIYFFLAFLVFLVHQNYYYYTLKCI